MKNHNGHITVYNGHHDAYYCKTCDEWLESACQDINCRYCAERPPKPSELSPEVRLTDKDNEMTGL